MKGKRGAQNPVLVGLTGGIATGKSSVAAIFRELGAEVIDADEEAHGVLSEDLRVREAVIREFGPEVARPNGSIDRESLGRLVFPSTGRRRLLERIVHPVVEERVRARIDQAAREEKRVIVLDVPLLFEAGWDRWMDKRVVVTCPAGTQRRRLMERGRLSRDEAEQRISAQWPLEKKVALADYVIDNGGTLEETRAQVLKLWGEITGDKEVGAHRARQEKGRYD